MEDILEHLDQINIILSDCKLEELKEIIGETGKLTQFSPNTPEYLEGRFLASLAFLYWRSHIDNQPE